VDIPATSDNIPGTLVLRDASGNLSAGALLISNNTRFQQYSGSYKNVANLISGSNFGTIIEGQALGQFVVGIRANDGSDSFSVVITDISAGAGNSDYTAVALRILATGVIGVGTASPNSAAQLDVSSTTRGFLPPRMTTTQRDAITSPPAGLMIYNTTTNKLNVRTASSWEAVTSA
jgi:hypothetical protein